MEIEMPRFFKWDFDNREVIEYERIGECNGCAQCCKATIRYRIEGNRTGVSEIEMAKDNPPYYNAGVMGDSVNKAKGIWSEYNDGDYRRFISLPTIEDDNQPCGMLVNDKCIIHERKSINALTLCMTWPIIPEHVKPFDKCSYSFREIKRTKLDENGTPIVNGN